MKKIKILSLTLLFVMVFILGACSTTLASADQLNPLKIWLQNKNGEYVTLVVVDEATGVNYVVVSKEGYDSAPSITPRLNPDGTLFITK